MTDAPPPIPAEDKDWTWVLERPCPECGFDSADVEPDQIGARLRDTVSRWQDVLGRAAAGTRPDPVVWSPVEYACHVRDVCALFGQRLAMMLELEDPEFSNWDQDRTAVAGRYDLAEPGTVSAQYAAEAAATAGAFDSVRGTQWQRTGRRSDGASFTVASFGAYFLHDIEHHLDDVGG